MFFVNGKNVGVSRRFYYVKPLRKQPKHPIHKQVNQSISMKHKKIYSLGFNTRAGLSSKEHYQTSLFCTGSISVEAALVLPFFIIVLYSLMMLNQLIITENEVHRGVGELGRYLAKQESDSISYTTLMIRFPSYVDSDRMQLVKGGVHGVAFLGSELPDVHHNLVLKTQYICQLPIPFIKTFYIPFHDCVIQRQFSGYAYDFSGEQMQEHVYVSDTQSVYHTHLDCSHIHVQMVYKNDKKQLSGLRVCKKCKRSTVKGDYVTVYGDCIHYDIGCSGLKRTIHILPKSEVGHLPLCSRCASRD